jgi:hypothetical protein
MDSVQVSKEERTWRFDRGKYSIQNAEDFYAWAKQTEENGSKIKYLFYNQEDVDNGEECLKDVRTSPHAWKEHTLCKRGNGNNDNNDQTGLVTEELETLNQVETVNQIELDKILDLAVIFQLLVCARKYAS